MSWPAVQLARREMLREYWELQNQASGKYQEMLNQQGWDFSISRRSSPGRSWNQYCYIKVNCAQLRAVEI